MRRFAGVALATMVALGCAGLHSVVGAECADGYVERDGTCVLASNVLDGSTEGGDGSTDGPVGTDGDLDGSTTDGVATDGTTSNDGGDAATDGAVDPDGSADATTCIPPLVACGNDCVDLTNDPLNCGQCGHVCPTLLCANSKCQGTLNGHVVLIGHDYSGASSQSQLKILGNAALITPATAIRVRSWEQYSAPGATAVVRSTINAAASAQNRTVVFTTAALPSDVLATTALNTDVLLLHDQPNAPASTLAALGASFAATIATFTKDGGVVLVTDGGSGADPQMSAFVKSAGLFDVDAENPISFGKNLSVIAPADVVGLGVLSPYAAGIRSVRFDCNDPNAGFVSWVVVDPNVDAGPPKPVVIHRVVP